MTPDLGSNRTPPATPAEATRTPLPWRPATILHLALKDDIDFAVRAVNSHESLLAALKASLPYLPSCPEKGKKGESCGPRFPYKPECPYMVARAAIATAKGETK